MVETMSKANYGDLMNPINNETHLVRETHVGTICGKQWDDHTIAWLGVPYAKPPVHTLRWKAPQDPLPWHDILQTDQFSKPCMQYGGLLLKLDSDIIGQPVGCEDCLYLNIWRPNTTDINLPVILFIHGGLNVIGEAATSLYHGANLARKSNMIVITVNFRLGIFGWFACDVLKTGDPLDDSGNYGLLDIIHALKWVQTNINAFGGDQQNITLMGESAGAFNIISLLASPLAKGLFHKAFAISPIISLFSAPMSMGYHKAKKNIVRLLKKDKLAMSSKDAHKLIAQKGTSWCADYLRSKDATELLLSTQKLSAFGVNDIGLTIDIFGGNRFSDGSVIPINFKETFQQGQTHPIPIIIGSTSDEMRIFEIALGIFSKIDNYQLCSLIQSFEPDTSQVNLSDVVPFYYQWIYQFVGSSIGSLLFEKLGIDPIANCLCQTQDVYVFKFTWHEMPPPFDFLIGASHMTPLPFIFGNFQRDINSIFRFAWCKSNEIEREQLSDKIMAYLSNFARTGSPNAPEQNERPFWTPWKNEIQPNRFIL